jgi:hypothetical protein
MKSGLWFSIIALCSWFSLNTSYLLAQPPAPSQAEIDSLAWKRYPIEGYAGKISIGQGETIDLMVANGDSGLVGIEYQMRVYRVGATDSLYYSVPGSYYLQYQPLHDNVGPIARFDRSRFPRDFKSGCSWTPVYTIEAARRVFGDVGRFERAKRRVLLSARGGRICRDEEDGGDAMTNCAQACCGPNILAQGR